MINEKNYLTCKMCGKSIYVGPDEKYQQEFGCCDGCGKILCEDCLCYLDKQEFCNICYDENNEGD